MGLLSSAAARSDYDENRQMSANRSRGRVGGIYRVLGVLGRLAAPRPLAGARGDEERRAGQGEQVLAQWAVEQPDHDEETGPAARDRDERPVALGQAEGLAGSPLPQQEQHAQSGQDDGR